MKPSPFVYHRPRSVAEAVALLREPDTKVLAGGQSLVPLLNMRLAAPAALVDINALRPELAYVDVSAGTVRVGALTRHRDLERSTVAAATLPLLGQATRLVAHPAIRNRGTTVGSIVHADPSAELPAVLLACDGAVELHSAAGSRVVAARDFFLAPLTSAIGPDELAVAARFTVPPPHSGTAFVEVSRRAGDYALAGIALVVTLDGDRHVAAARAVGVSLGPTPVLVDLTPAVGGAPADAIDWSAAGELVSSTVAPEADLHATADYRRHLAGVLTARAGALALREAL